MSTTAHNRALRRVASDLTNTCVLQRGAYLPGVWTLSAVEHVPGTCPNPSLADNETASPRDMGALFLSLPQYLSCIGTVDTTPWRVIRAFISW
jgi:hypothetical protein